MDNPSSICGPSRSHVLGLSILANYIINRVKNVGYKFFCYINHKLRERIYLEECALNPIFAPMTKILRLENKVK